MQHRRALGAPCTQIGRGGDERDGWLARAGQWGTCLVSLQELLVERRAPAQGCWCQLGLGRGRGLAKESGYSHAMSVTCDLRPQFRVSMIDELVSWCERCVGGGQLVGHWVRRAGYCNSRVS